MKNFFKKIKKIFKKEKEIEIVHNMEEHSEFIIGGDWIHKDDLLMAIKTCPSHKIKTIYEMKDKKIVTEKEVINKKDLIDFFGLNE